MKKALVLCMAVAMCFVWGCEKKTTTTPKTNPTPAQQQAQNGLGPFKLVAGNIADNQLTSSLKLTETSFTVEEGKTTYKTTVTNMTAADVKVAEIDMIIKDAKGTEMITLKTFINNLAANEKKTVETSVESKLDGFATIEYKVLETQQAE